MQTSFYCQMNNCACGHVSIFKNVCYTEIVCLSACISCVVVSEYVEEREREGDVCVYILAW